MTNKDYAVLAGKTLSAKKAQDIVIIDIQEKASFADYFVICSGTSERQIHTLVEEVEEAFAKEGLLVKSVEGKQSSGWILMDFGDIIVNLFTKEMREKYSIEKIWGGRLEGYHKSCDSSSLSFGRGNRGIICH